MASQSAKYILSEISSKWDLFLTITLCQCIFQVPNALKILKFNEVFDYNCMACYSVKKRSPICCISKNRK